MRKAREARETRSTHAHLTLLIRFMLFLVLDVPHAVRAAVLCTAIGLAIPEAHFLPVATAVLGAATLYALWAHPHTVALQATVFVLVQVVVAPLILMPKARMLSTSPPDVLTACLALAAAYQAYTGPWTMLIFAVEVAAAATAMSVTAAGRRIGTALFINTDPNLLWSVGTVYDAAFSPDGRVAVVSWSAGDVLLHDCASGRAVRQICSNNPLGYYPATCAFSPDGRRVAVATAELLIYDVEHDAVIHRVGAVHRLDYARLKFFPDSDWLAVWTAGKLDVWSVAHARATLVRRCAVGGWNSVPVDVSADGRFVVGATIGFQGQGAACIVVDTVNMRKVSLPCTRDVHSVSFIAIRTVCVACESALYVWELGHSDSARMLYCTRHIIDPCAPTHEISTLGHAAISLDGRFCVPFGGRAIQAVPPATRVIVPAVDCAIIRLDAGPCKLAVLFREHRMASRFRVQQCAGWLSQAVPLPFMTARLAHIRNMAASVLGALDATNCLTPVVEYITPVRTAVAMLLLSAARRACQLLPGEVWRTVIELAHVPLDTAAPLRVRTTWSSWKRSVTMDKC